MNEDWGKQPKEDDLWKNTFIVVAIIAVLALFGVSVALRIEINNLNSQLESYQGINPDEESHFTVGTDNVTAIELVYYQTQDFVDELIVYKDGTGVARKGNQHIYFTPTECKLIIYHGE